MISTVDKNNKFSFKPITADDILQQVKLDIIKSSVIEDSSSEKVLGITIDSKFTFEKHINELSKKRN